MLKTSTRADPTGQPSTVTGESKGEANLSLSYKLDGVADVRIAPLHQRCSFQIPQICDNVTVHGKRDFANAIKLRDLP